MDKLSAWKLWRNGVDDAGQVEALMKQVPAGVKAEAVAADGAFDKKQTSDCVNKHGTKAVIPPCQNAKIWQPENSQKVTI